MAWNVEHTDEFAGWYSDLDESQQDDVTAVGLLLIEQGPRLPFFRFRRGFMDRSMLTCVSCEYRAAADR